MSSLMLEFSLSCYLRMLHEVLTASEINIFTQIRKLKVLFSAHSAFSLLVFSISLGLNLVIIEIELENQNKSN